MVEKTQTIYIFEPIARLVTQPEDHDYQLQDALEQISESLRTLNQRLDRLEKRQSLSAAASLKKP